MLLNKDRIKKFKGSRLIDVRHNSRGFRDNEHSLKPNSRIIFLGDSFVWGYDVEQSERFTDKLEKALSNWSVYNLGVSGYGTDQEYLLFKQQYNFYKPNIVFLVFCTDNDETDNTQNIRFGTYKPYFIINGENLELRGTPVPRNEEFFIYDHNILTKSYLVRLATKAFYKFTNPKHIEFESPTLKIINDIYELSKKNGAYFIIGLQERSPKIETFLATKKISYLVLSNPYKYRDHGRHWTPEGHTFVADAIYEFLLKNKYITKQN